jgi:FixJ family two-component response regulator
MRETVYIVDPVPEECTRFAAALAGEPFGVERYDCAEQFFEQIGARPSGCVLAPADLPGMGVRALIEEIRRRHFRLVVVVIGRESDLATAVELVRAGAADFLESPFSDYGLRSVVRKLIGGRA